MARHFTLALILPFLITSCLSSASTEISMEEQSFLADEISNIEIEMGDGIINIMGVDQDLINIFYSSSDDDSPTITQDNTLIQIYQPNSRSNDQLNLQVPSGIIILIQTFNGDIHLNGDLGKVEIRSTAGDVIANSFSGEGLLWSGRGDISVTGGGGELTVIGEHGELTVTRFRGPISMTTIMGKIQYSGDTNSAGSINLETDHGPVNASLLENSSYRININTTSGIVTCSGASLKDTPTGCRGETGNAKEIFNIRTVSGRIDFQILPRPREE